VITREVQAVTIGSSRSARVVRARLRGSSGSAWADHVCLRGECAGSSGALTRQFRNATPISLDALNSIVHLKNTLEVLFLLDFFYHGQNFTLYRVEVHFEQDGSSIVTNKKFT
jgi:hypothetical protein